MERYAAIVAARLLSGAPGCWPRSVVSELTSAGNKQGGGRVHAGPIRQKVGSKVLAAEFCADPRFQAGGSLSNTSSPSAKMTHGCFLLAQMCLVGRSQDVSSRVPALTRISPSSAGPAIQEPHSGQTHRVIAAVQRGMQALESVH
jgi:hypothetical protein